MEPKINTLTIERFRAIRQLSIENLGRVNLITGRNNTGKSSVLEAIRLLASGASKNVIRDILQFREEYGEEIGPFRSLGEEGLFQVSGLFHGFPTFSGVIDPIVIESRCGQVPMKLSMAIVWVRWEKDSEGRERPITQPDPPFAEEDWSPAIVAKDIADNVRVLTGRSLSRPPYPLRQPAEESRMPCLFVSPYGGAHTAELGELWDKIALSEGEKPVVDALRIIDPRISAVSMVGGDSSRQHRRAIVRATGFPRPVPLRTFGDGLNRLFGIALSLVNAKDGLLLIDEFENGMHHTVQTDVWRAIFKLAKDLDIQVFATSHSWDSIEAFQKAASEVPEEGVLIRLTRKGEDIIPTLLREDELAIAARDRIEVR